MNGSGIFLFHKLESTMEERVCCAGECRNPTRETRGPFATHQTFPKGRNDGAGMDVHERPKSRTSRLTNFEVHQLQDSTSLCGN
jgi:hypothetical protein